MDWVSRMFADENIRTPFEIKMGTEVSSMQATELDATDESRAILDARAKGDMIDELTAKFKAQGATPADALLAAQTTVGTVKREHRSTSVDGTNLPPGLQSLWVGTDIDPRAGGK
jgi:membrane protease subunit (stomatin/prohibitin family)